MQNPTETTGASIATETTASSNAPQNPTETTGASIATETTASSNAPSGEFKVPPRCSFNECIENLSSKFGIDSAIKRANDEGLTTLATKLMQLKKIVNEWLLPLYRTGGFPSNPRKLTGNGAAVYALVKDNGQFLIKFGMSEHCRDRVNEQSHKGAVIIMGQEEIEEFVSDETVDSIEELGLPGLAVHEDHQGKLERILKMQLIEMYLATAYKSITNTVGELLVRVPSPRVRDSISIQTFHLAAIEFMKNIPEGGVFRVFTWPTIRSWLYAQESPFLQSILRAEGGFVTEYCTRQFLGSKCGEFENAVKYCPRAEQVQPVVEDIKKVLSDNGNPEQIRNTLKPIQDGGKDGYDSYVYPSDKAVAEGACIVMDKQLVSLPTNHVIMIERKTFNAIKEYRLDWFNKHIDMKRAIEVMEKKALFLVYTRCGRRIIVTLSLFTAFAEKTQTETRFNSIKAQLTGLDLMAASKNVESQEVFKKRRILCAFLMGLEGLPVAPNGKNTAAKTGKRKRTTNGVEERIETPSTRQAHGDAENESHMEGTYNRYIGKWTSRHMVTSLTFPFLRLY
jgi:hypothetical protein